MLNAIELLRNIAEDVENGLDDPNKLADYLGADPVEEED